MPRRGSRSRPGSPAAGAEGGGAAAEGTAESGAGCAAFISAIARDNRSTFVSSSRMRASRDMGAAAGGSAGLLSMGAGAGEGGVGGLEGGGVGGSCEKELTGRKKTPNDNTTDTRRSFTILHDGRAGQSILLGALHPRSEGRAPSLQLDQSGGSPPSGRSRSFSLPLS